MTPEQDIELFLKAFEERENIDWTSARVLDPCAGGNIEKRNADGDITELAHNMSYPVVLNKLYGIHTDTIDIREDSLAEVKADYLTANLEPYDIIITNPPFSRATEIIEKAHEDATDHGFIIMLLRLNFFGSLERQSFFEKYIPKWCFVHRKRISFTDRKDNKGRVRFNKTTGEPLKGATDSIEYCHMVFQNNVKPPYTKLIVI